MNIAAPAVYRPADNPFASHRVDGLRYRGRLLSPPALERRLDSLGSRAAIVGPKGSGKSTLLEELSIELQNPVALVRIPGSHPRPLGTAIQQLPVEVTASHSILVDSAEQISTLGWHWLLQATRRARYLIVTLHRPGRLPTLIECHTDHRLLRDLVEELAPADVRVLAPGLGDLFERHGGNIRSCLRELYDVYAGRESRGKMEKWRKGDLPTLP